MCSSLTHWSQIVNDTACSLEAETLLSVLKTNTVGFAFVSQVALPFLERGRVKNILHISSTRGSIASVDTATGFVPAVVSYGMSKAALDMLVCTWMDAVRIRRALHTCKQKLERLDFIVITLCPGRVKTGAWSIVHVGAYFVF